MVTGTGAGPEVTGTGVPAAAGGDAVGPVAVTTGAGAGAAGEADTGTAGEATEVCRGAERVRVVTIFQGLRASHDGWLRSGVSARMGAAGPAAVRVDGAPPDRPRATAAEATTTHTASVAGRIPISTMC